MLILNTFDAPRVPPEWACDMYLGSDHIDLLLWTAWGPSSRIQEAEVAVEAVLERAQNWNPRKRFSPAGQGSGNRNGSEFFLVSLP